MIYNSIVYPPNLSHSEKNRAHLAKNPTQKNPIINPLFRLILAVSARWLSAAPVAVSAALFRLNLPPLPALFSHVDFSVPLNSRT